MTVKLTGTVRDIDWPDGDDGWFCGRDAEGKSVGPYRRGEMNAVLNGIANPLLRDAVHAMIDDIENGRAVEMNLLHLGRYDGEVRVAEFGDGPDILYVAVDGREFIEGLVSEDADAVCDEIGIRADEVEWEDPYQPTSVRL